MVIYNTGLVALICTNLIIWIKYCYKISISCPCWQTETLIFLLSVNCVISWFINLLCFWSLTGCIWVIKYVSGFYFCHLASNCRQRGRTCQCHNVCRKGQACKCLSKPALHSLNIVDLLTDSISPQDITIGVAIGSSTQISMFVVWPWTVIKWLFGVYI